MKRDFKCLLILAVFSLMVGRLLSCGGGGGPSYEKPEEYEGPTATVIIEGNASLGGFEYDEDGVLTKDAGGTVTGSGDTGDGVTSSSDAADLTCEFFYAATTPETTIHVVDSINKCTVGHGDYIPGASLNKCIVCTTSSGGDCSISCTGMVPSNTATANDYVSMTFTVTSIFATDMASINKHLKSLFTLPHFLSRYTHILLVTTPS